MFSAVLYRFFLLVHLTSAVIMLALFVFGVDVESAHAVWSVSLSGLWFLENKFHNEAKAKLEKYEGGELSQ